MRKNKRLIALVLVAIVAFSFMMITASAATVDTHNHSACAQGNGTTIEPQRAYPCPNCESGMLRKVLINGVYWYRCDRCPYMTQTP